MREILDRGWDDQWNWLNEQLTPGELRELVIEFRGAGLAEPARERVRQKLGLTPAELPRRPYLGFTFAKQ